MNICFLTVSDAGESSGGVEAVSTCLIKQFVNDGHNVILCYSYHKYNSSPCVIDSSRKFRLPNININCSENISFLVDILIKERIDVVLNETWYIDYHNLCKEARKQAPFKLIFHYHGDPISPLWSLIDDFQTVDYVYSGHINRFLHRVYQVVKFPLGIMLRYRGIKSRFLKYVSDSDAVVVLSESYKGMLSKLLGNKSLNNVYSILNPIKFVDVEFNHKKNQVVFVGRLVRQKRVDRLLRIWNLVEREVPNASLLIVGDGEERTHLLELANSLALRNVVFIGQKPALEIMAESKVLALVSSHEGMGLVALEAMSVGTIPVFYDSLRCLRGLIKSGVSGLCVHSFSNKEFANAIVLLLKNAAFANAISMRGSIQSKNSGNIHVFEAWYDLFFSLTGKR